MLGGGFFSTMFKHNRMDEAQAAMNEARGHLRRLKRELLDVNLTGDLKMDVGSFLTFADYFFDGVIADWMVQSKIGDALNQVREARRQVSGIRKRLQEMRQTLETEQEVGKVNGMSWKCIMVYIRRMYKRLILAPDRLPVVHNDHRNTGGTAVF